MRLLVRTLKAKCMWVCCLQLQIYSIICSTPTNSGRFFIFLRGIAWLTGLSVAAVEQTFCSAQSMSGSVKLIDQSVKDSILRFPTVELIRRLFPDVKFRGRSVLCNPLRGEAHASLSCFRGRDGFPHWKDHATGETGDNIDFYRLVCPDKGYVEAVDSLSWLLLGRSALQDVPAGQVVSLSFSPQQRRHVPAREPDPVLKVVSESPYRSDSPADLVSYTRGRGISDEVAGVLFRIVRFVNTNREGRFLTDEVTGLPVPDGKGGVLLDSGENVAVAMGNDIGGFSLRIPDTAPCGGFKGTNASFLTTVLADGGAPRSLVRFAGDGDSLVTGFSYDSYSRFLYVNRMQGFTGVEPWAVRFAVAFLDQWTGRYLEGRDLRAAGAVLNALNGPVHRKVTVVEGMFDAASVVELNRLAGRGCTPDGDLVVLNSISNISWAVPFLSMHGEVRSLLDNDICSSAGQKAFAVMQESVRAFAARAGVACCVWSDSPSISPSKDVNDYLRRVKGFAEAPKETPRPAKTMKVPSRKSTPKIS